jgi:M6 family metalloprotease-like protein
MAQFPIENPDNPKTSGDGNFLKLDAEEYNHFYDSTTPRCEGFLVDRPPHNSAYFQKQLEAVKNYYLNVSGDNLTFTTNIISNSNSSDGYYTVSDSMEYYAKGDALLAEFFSEALDSAKSDIEDHLSTAENVVFIVFHAGLGQDFSLPGLDPTIYDLKSAYIDEEMMAGVTPTVILGDSIQTGILLPETQNMIYYDIVEDIFGNPDYGTDDLCDIQLGLTGIFAFLLGYELGLPPLFNPETGDPGVGFFGLMDHGSNNGRGVIPAPPSPWTRSLPAEEWSAIKTISPVQSLNTTITVYALDSILYKIDISENEYFLIENRNNWVAPETDIDSLRRKHKIDENQMGHWFDTVIEEFSDDQIQIDEDTQVITRFNHYDYGLPGSGVLIWHIKEPDPSTYNDGVNSDLDNRHIQIEEADGAQDIGTKSYAFFASDDPTAGTRWDMWFHENEGYEFANPDLENAAIFDYWSSPNTRTVDGSDSFLSIEILSEISDSMDIRITFGDGVEIEYLTDEPVQYLGNAVENDIGFVYYAKDDSIYSHSHLAGPIAIDEYFAFEDSIILTCCNNNALDTIIISDKHYAWIDTSGGQFEFNEESTIPAGFINDFLHSERAPISLISSDSSLAFGDLDLDGLDEIINIEDGNIIARNSNGTLVNGFPAAGNFLGVPLISNILPPQYGSDIGKPEIICRERSNIVILSNRGERLRQLSSYDIDQPLAMVPFWRADTTALIDGSRLFLFDLDMDHSYWINPRSRPSGFPLSTGDHFEPNNSSKMRTKAYNYPNPITDGSTTFRFFVRSPEVSEVKVNIYNAAGYLADNLIKKDDDLSYYEFNEIIWDASQFDAGLYLAEIKPNVGNSELVRLVVIK